MAWTKEQIGNLQGKVAVVTGGNIGLGFHTSLELARKNARVVIATRQMVRGETARARILAEVPSADVSILTLDLVDLASVHRFGEAFGERFGHLDILVNNAAVVSLDAHQLTPNGWEMHMATNHLGHFALTGVLFPMLSAHARVVAVSSGGYRGGVIDFDDFHWQKREYKKMRAYGDSKLANLLFMGELQRKFLQVGSSALSVGAHPGLSATERHGRFTGFAAVLDKLLASPMEEGVLPQLRAATDPTAKGGDYFGPRYGLWGGPTPGSLKAHALDEGVARRLWTFSEELTGVSYP